MQALIVTAGDLLYARIQCPHPFLFTLAACVNGIVFTMINYALVFALDNIGMGLGVIILLMQVAGGGGTFPPAVLPKIFQILYTYIPFHYSMGAMRECIGGMYGNTYWSCIGTLFIFFAVFMLLGLALYRPALGINKVIIKSKEATGIML